MYVHVGAIVRSSRTEPIRYGGWIRGIGEESSICPLAWSKRFLSFLVDWCEASGSDMIRVGTARWCFYSVRENHHPHPCAPTSP